jgi:hypothetical protein
MHYLTSQNELQQKQTTVQPHPFPAEMSMHGCCGLPNYCTSHFINVKCDSVLSSNTVVFLCFCILLVILIEC